MLGYFRGPDGWSGLAGDEGGGMGEGVGRWPMEGGQGGRWGGTKEQCGSNKRCRGGVGRWPMEGGQGGRWGAGHQRAVWEQQKAPCFFFFAPLKT